MKQKPTISLMLLASIFLLAACSYPDKIKEVLSPNGNIKMVLMDLQSDVNQKDMYHVPAYKVSFHGNDIVNPSRIGFTAGNETYSFYEDLELIHSETSSYSKEYTMTSGKDITLENHYNELKLHFVNKAGKEFRIDFRAYNEGVAFRYIIEKPSDDTITVEKEFTSFAFPRGKKWVLPYDKVTNWSPAYETYFTNGIPIGQPAPSKEGWSFPALFEVNNTWVLLSEAGVYETYCASHLEQDASGRIYKIRFPEKEEHFGDGWVKPRSPAPWNMPWRFMAIGDLSTITENNLVSHLAKPNKLADTSWIEPGIASWSWWSSTSGRNLDNLKKYVDLAEAMNWEYSLVDAGWEIMEGGTLKDLVEYAETKQVDLLLWYNSGGRKSQEGMDSTFILEDSKMRRKEFQRIRELGIKGIKADFFNSDKQFIIQQYLDIIKDAARFNLVVNFHGCTLPRGWRRTYPNLLTMEAVKGAEAYRFAKDYPEKAVWHNTILPYTRNVVGPMDYTPVTISDNTYPHLTTAAHELALSVVYESGIVHMADRAETYMGLPEPVQSILQDIPAAWDSTKYIEGYPGKFAVIARKKENTWYIGAINASGQRTVQPDLTFLNDYAPVIYVTDGYNDVTLDIQTYNNISEVPEKLVLGSAGGFLMKAGN